MVPIGERPGTPVFGVGEETQRRPPLVPKGRIPRAARSGGSRVAGRAGPCSLVLIAGHLCGCMRLACVGHLYVWCVGHPYVWYYNITGHSMSMCMLAHEYMDGALHCLHACA